MNKKGIKKILFIFLLVIGMFFINSEVVKALENNVTLCSYNGPWGTIEFYTKVNHSKVGVAWRLIEFDNCGSTIDTSCASVDLEDDTLAKALGDSYNFKGLTTSSDTYSCPVLHYTYEQSQSIFGKYTKDVKISAKSLDPNDSTVVSSIGETLLHGSKKECDDLYSTITGIQSAYDSTLGSNISKIESIITNINKGYDEYKQTDELLTQALSYKDDLVNRFNSISNKKSFIANNCNSDVISAYSKLNDDLAKSGTILSSYVNTLTNQIKNLRRTAEKNGDQDLINKIDEILGHYGIHLNNIRKSSDLGSGNGAVDCEGLLGTAVLDDIKEVLSYVRIIVPILVIVLGIVDFSKVVLGGDEKEMSKAISNLVKRLIAAVAVFFAPIIIMMVIDLVDSLAGGCDIRGW